MAGNMGCGVCFKSWLIYYIPLQALHFKRDSDRLEPVQKGRAGLVNKLEIDLLGIIKDSVGIRLREGLGREIVFYKSLLGYHGEEGLNKIMFLNIYCLPGTAVSPLQVLFIFSSPKL